MELGSSGPQVKVEPESPFIQAAWEGNVSLIRTMLKGFPGVIEHLHVTSQGAWFPLILMLQS